MNKNWEYRLFKDVLPIKMGKTPPRGDGSMWDIKKETNNYWVSIADISQNEGKTVNDTKEYISDKAAEKMYKVKANSLLMSFKLSIGKMSFAGVDLFTNEAIIAIPENDDYILKFLYYYLSSYNWKTLTEGNEKVKGATLNKDSIGRILLPNISKTEQQRIVDILDVNFAKIDEIKADAEHQLQNAKDLFTAALKDFFALKDGWSTKTLDDISTDMYRGNGIKRDEIRTDGIQCVRYGEIYTAYNYWFDKCVSHTDESIIKSKKYFEYGDILFTITGESVEDIAKSVAYLGNDKCLAGGDIVVMKHNQNPKYLAYALSTPNAIAQKGYGKTKLKVVHSNIPSIKRIVLPFPPTLKEQQEIAEKLDALAEKVSLLQSNCNEVISLCADLKQASLKKIFG